MTSFKIGSLCSIENHPYTINTANIKISALAQMTPPIMVVTEILNPDDKFDSDSGDKKNKQLKCIFYSHKTSKYENSWFDINQLKLIYQREIQPENEDNVIKTGIKYLKNFSIQQIKDEFLIKQVLLKSCDLELGKKKTTFEQDDFKTRSKINAHLDFLPPVMTVIDVKLNEEKIKYDAKDGTQKRIASNFLLKCKWFNPNSSIFSEDFLPIESVDIVKLDIANIEMINNCINENKLFEFSYDTPIKLESGLTLNHTFIKPIEITFNHYKYKLKYFDFFIGLYSEMDVENIIIKNIKNHEDIILNKIPRYDKSQSDFISTDDFTFNINEFYRITYKDVQSRITKRVIHITDFVKGKVIIADCLLRKGEIRHFKTGKESVLKIEELDQDLFS